MISSFGIFRVFAFSGLLMGAIAQPAYSGESPAADAPRTYESIFGGPSKNVPAGVPLLAEPVIGFDPTKMDEYSDDQLKQQAEFHWAYYETHEADAVLDKLIERHPNDTDILWRKGRILYDIGEEMDYDDHEGRMKFYEGMIAVTGRCMELNPKEAGCVFFNGVGEGRAATVRGLLHSLFAAEKVESAWLTTVELKTDYRSSRGGGIHVWANLALGMFYRMVPDWWILKLVAGARGDKEKSVEYLKKAVEMLPNRMDTRKELGVALVCLGGDEDDEKLIAEGREVLEKVAAGTWRDYRNTDLIDMEHAAILVGQEPDVVCGYSRDGYEKLDKDSINEYKKIYKDKK